MKQLKHLASMDMILAFVFIITKLLLFLFKFSTALDSISPSEFMIDGKTLVSEKGTFELGFLVLAFPRKVTWEYGTKISQLEPLFGLQTGAILLMIPLAC